MRNAAVLCSVAFWSRALWRDLRAQRGGANIWLLGLVVWRGHMEVVQLCCDKSLGSCYSTVPENSEMTWNRLSLKNPPPNRPAVGSMLTPCGADKGCVALAAVCWNTESSVFLVSVTWIISILGNTGWITQGLLHWLYTVVSHCIALFSPFTVWFETVTMDFSRLHTYTPPQCVPENTGYTYALRWELFFFL